MLERAYSWTFFLLFLSIAGCGDDVECGAGTVEVEDECVPLGDADSDADTDVDTDVDADTDADSDSDTEIDPRLVCEGLPDWSASSADSEEALLVLINEKRAEAFDCATVTYDEPSPPLAMNHSLRCASRKLAISNAESCGDGDCNFTNCTAVGEGFCQRYQAFGYGSFTGWAGNFTGASTAEDALAVWLDGNSCTQVMSPAYEDFGAGFYNGFENVTSWAVGYATQGKANCGDSCPTFP